MDQRGPQDAVPGQPPQYGQQPGPYYQPPQQPYYGQPPIIINNVINNAVRPGIVVRRHHVNHWLHFWLTFLTGGLWAPIWIHATRKSQRRVVYR